jgi:hypothetical protein
MDKRVSGSAPSNLDCTFISIEDAGEGKVKFIFESDPSGGVRFTSPKAMMWSGIFICSTSLFTVAQAWLFPEHAYDRPLSTILVGPGIITGAGMAVIGYRRRRIK